jgi:hypothetical protein
MNDLKDQSAPVNILLTCYQGARYFMALLLAGGEWPVSCQTALRLQSAPGYLRFHLKAKG